MSERALRTSIAVVALAGATVALYLVVVHYSESALVCPTGGCETVQHSAYATLVGVPVALLGLAAFVVIFATALSVRELARALGVATALASAAYAAYLVYVQVAVLDAVCVWCVASDVLLGVLVVLTAVRAARR